MPYILAIDQGTTSSRAIIFTEKGEIHSMAQYDLQQHYPKAGWVEHDPMEILETTLLALGNAIIKGNVAKGEIAAIGITNQRETTIVWDKQTGKPVYPAIVWQCRRTAALCDEIKASPLSAYIQEKTGLLPDAYFSATKIKWILDNISGARERAEAGELLCGTVESWLIWNLSGGRHISDYSNCSRTMLFDIEKLCWDERICNELGIPMQMLPEPVPNAGEYCCVRSGIAGIEALAGVPICGAAGDQQAALFGQCCFLEGQAKNTYGTGCFTLMNIGEKSLRSQNGLLTSIAWNIGGKTTYALEGSVFNGGSCIQWLRDGLGIIKTAPQVNELAAEVEDNGGVYLVPAFTGLGAPYWDAYARGLLIGMTRGTSKAHIARAALEGIAFQVADLIDIMEHDTGKKLLELRVDGGAAASELLLQFQADLLRTNIDRPIMLESTALGAANLAALGAGIYKELSDIESQRLTEKVFAPQADAALMRGLYAKWHEAVRRAQAWEKI
ncbi:MAG: glycerol kinase GlpK [Firmicutes bacterium]|nr:glycerol kinase GlpK [Bacillota bacterium]